MPSDPQAPSRRLRFGEFEVDPRSHELLRAGRRVHLQEKSFLVLAALLERPGEVISRDELAATLWPKDHFVDAEHGLNTAVRRLRQALGDSAETPRFVETMPRIGYRFLAAVEPAPGATDAERGATAAEASARAEAEEPSTPGSRVTSRRTLLVAGIGLAVLAVGWVTLREKRTRTPPPGEVVSTAESSPVVTTVDELLARARFLRNHKRFEESKRFVEEALELDPRNADAVSGLALALLADRQFEAARETAARAIELDPKAWEAHRVLGNLALWSGDFAGAERHYRDSVEANPTDSKSRNRLARHLLGCGRLDEAEEQMAVSRRLAPDDPDVQNIWVQHALLSGDYEGAIRLGEIWMTVWGGQLQSESVSWVRYQLALAYVGARRLDEAVAHLRAIDPDDDLSVAIALGYVGRRDEARALLAAQEADGEPPGAPSNPARTEDLALAYIAIGDLDRAFRLLDRLVEARWHPSYLSVPLFAAIRADPRWPVFAERVESEFHRGKSDPRPLVRPEPFSRRFHPTRPPAAESAVRTSGRSRG